MKKIRWTIFGILGFLLMSILVMTGSINHFDEIIYTLISSIKSPFMTAFFRLITIFANTRFIVILNLLIIIYVLIKHNRALLIIPISSLMSVIVNNLVKLIFARSRPLGIALISESFYSFPSGHSMISILFYGLVLYLINKHKIKGYKVYSCFLSLLIILIGLSRIYLGVHFASDIIGGWLLGLGILNLEILFYEKYNKE